MNWRDDPDFVEWATRREIHEDGETWKLLWEAWKASCKRADERAEKAMDLARQAAVAADEAGAQCEQLMDALRAADKATIVKMENLPQAVLRARGIMRRPLNPESWVTE